MSALTTFLNDDSGAVTVDWVVLTASLTVLGLLVLEIVRDGVNDISNETADDIAAVEQITFERRAPTPPTTPPTTP